MSETENATEPGEVCFSSHHVWFIHRGDNGQTLSCSGCGILYPVSDSGGGKQIGWVGGCNKRRKSAPSHLGESFTTDVNKKQFHQGWASWFSLVSCLMHVLLLCRSAAVFSTQTKPSPPYLWLYLTLVQFTEKSGLTSSTCSCLMPRPQMAHLITENRKLASRAVRLPFLLL